MPVPGCRSAPRGPAEGLARGHLSRGNWALGRARHASPEPSRLPAQLLVGAKSQRHGTDDDAQSSPTRVAGPNRWPTSPHGQSSREEGARCDRAGGSERHCDPHSPRVARRGDAGIRAARGGGGRRPKRWPPLFPQASLGAPLLRGRSRCRLGVWRGPRLLACPPLGPALPAGAAARCLLQTPRGPRRARESAPRGAGVFPRRCSRLRVLLQRGGANVGCSVGASPRVTVFCYFKRKDYVSGTNSDERRVGKLQCENKWGPGADRGSDTLLGPRQAGARDSLEQSWPRPGAAGVGKSGGGEPAARPPGRAGKSGRQRPRGRRAGPASGQDATPSAVGEGSRRKWQHP